MTFSIYRRTRSARLTVTLPDGRSVVVENLQGDDGFSIEFRAKRTMSDELGEFEVVAYNLPAEVISLMESAQVRRVDDLDSILVGATLQTSAVAADGADALETGFLIVELEAGYDGSMSRVYKSIGARTSSGYGGGGGPRRGLDGRFARQVGGLTHSTTIYSADGVDGIVLGLPSVVFPAGATLYELVDYLRRLAGLGPGNLSPGTLAGIIGDARLSSPYAVSGGDAIGRLKNVLQYMPIRWFVDDREIWICGRDDVPNPYGAPAYIPGEPQEPDLLISRPRRVDGGRVAVECLLCPRLLPGHVMRLSEAGLDAALQGLTPDAKSIVYANVPPGLYRIDEVSHTGSTSEMGNWTTSVLLRPGVAQDAA